MGHSTNKSSPRVQRWTYTVEADEVSFVLPDGCVDILVSSCGKTDRVLVGLTDWDFSPRQVRLKAGTSLIGYRLRPGTTVRLSDLQIENGAHSNLEPAIEGSVRHDQEVEEIIYALSLPGSGVERLAKQQGVSERTLQRRFKDLSLPPPVFWRQLGRARRAVRALPCRVPLSDIAFTYGYSDQAHMTREFLRWFGRTPAQLRRDPDTLNDLAQPGLGNWSDETVLKPVSLT